MQRRIAVTAVLVMIALAACGSPPEPSAGGTTPIPTPAPAVTPTAAPTPTFAGPSGSPTPTATPGQPTPSPAKPKPSAAAGKPISCTGKITQTKPAASGTGPGGSLVKTGSPAVALTFDDGPDPINTPKILDALQQCGVKATFCVVGFRARDNPGLIKRIAAEGHTLCNHSWQHLFDLAKRDDTYIRKDLENTNKMILRAAPPGARVPYFRAPGGNFTTKLVKIASDLGMKSIYWHVDPRDWESAKYGKGTAMVNHIIAAVERDVRPGSIVLSHDNGKPDTIVAYRTLLPWLKARYTLIALPDIPPPPPSPAPATPLP